MLSAEQLRRRVKDKLQEQRGVTLSLLRLREQLGGSLFARYGECGKESCACQKGQKHGPYWVLSTRSAGRGGFAYLDDDARPDPQWLRYLVTAIEDGDHAGAGGPNLPPPGDGAIAECVACSPGGPTHVLLSDTIAEHIPGCNMAFRCDRLEAVGGFDPRFRVAGDDVDVCWLLQREGWTLGFLD